MRTPILPACSSSPRLRPPRSVPLSSSAVSYRPRWSCAGCSRVCSTTGEARECARAIAGWGSPCSFRDVLPGRFLANGDSRCARYPSPARSRSVHASSVGWVIWSRLSAGPQELNPSSKRRWCCVGTRLASVAGGARRIRPVIHALKAPSTRPARSVSMSPGSPEPAAPAMLSLQSFSGTSTASCRHPRNKSLESRLRLLSDL